MSDYDKAVNRAIKSLAAAMVERDGQDAENALWRAFRDATIVAHWALQEYECECFVCMGDFTIHQAQILPE